MTPRPCRKSAWQLETDCVTFELSLSTRLSLLHLSRHWSVTLGFSLLEHKRDKCPINPASLSTTSLCRVQTIYSYPLHVLNIETNVAYRLLTKRLHCWAFQMKKLCLYMRIIEDYVGFPVRRLAIKLYPMHCEGPLHTC